MPWAPLLSSSTFKEKAKNEAGGLRAPSVYYVLLIDAQAYNWEADTGANFIKLCFDIMRKVKAGGFYAIRRGSVSEHCNLISFDAANQQSHHRLWPLPRARESQTNEAKMLLVVLLQSSDKIWQDVVAWLRHQFSRWHSALACSKARREAATLPLSEWKFSNYEEITWRDANLIFWTKGASCVIAAEGRDFT